MNERKSGARRPQTPSKARKGQRAEKPSAPRGPGRLDRAIRALARFVVGAALRVGIVFAVILGGAVWAMHAQLPEADALFDGRARGSVTLLDRNGDVFAWRGEQYGGEIRPGDVSPHLVHAILAAEDRRFYSHWGVDPRGIARAALVNLRAGRVVQGGSTLTQQVAKNVFLTDERSIERKLMEVPMAFAMELKYDKNDILALYLNRVYLGAGTYGFEAASQRYFGKSAKFVSPAEAAMLAGLLKAPSRFAPTTDIAQAQGRAAVIVRAMESEGYLTAAQAQAALGAPAGLSQAAAARIGAQFADWAMADGPDYLTTGTAEDVVIRTTFDPRAQRAAEAALAHVFETRVKPDSRAQAAIVVMTPDGAVRAVVGGRDGRAGGFNRATQALRQTGSAFKPFVYAAALERGMSPNDVVADAPLTLAGWSPENYGGGYSGPVTLTDALARSINTVAVRVGERAGRDRVRDVAKRLGISSPLAEGPALALGVSEATLIEMTGAYAAFASGGLSGAPWGLREIRLRGDDAPLMRADAQRRRVLDHRVAGRVTAMLEEAILRGTGTRAALPDGRPAAGKTGTTQAARDAWFIGFTADYVAGVWMGNDDNAPLTGVTGGGLPAEIWRDTMARLHEGAPVRSLPALREAPARPATVAASAGGDAEDETLLGAILADVMRALRE
ncbi:MAG: transglycosylase domain-containing protein [Rubrimonas sp.]|uniref:transglycosylase domain-containing protein n=1 Tax=Rubrimonas sp. TaxID=2036015 RepID=UPI002FDCF7D2